MSNTDSTRPYEVLAKDPTAKRVMLNHGVPGETDPEYMPVYYSGYSSFKGHKKIERKQIRRKLRAHQREALHRIKHAVDHEVVDLPPIRGDRRCISYSLS